MLVRATAALLLGLALAPAGAADLRLGAPGPAGAYAGSGPAGTRIVATLSLDPGTTEVLRTARPARTVVIGDPAIVEASATNETTLLLTAKAAGFTNLILLDEDGNEFFRRIVRVGIPPRPIIVHRGDAVQSFLCDPICNLPSDRAPQATVPETIAGETGGGAAPRPAGPAGSGARPGTATPARP
jgi:hypothetical protein